jgi:hypothetical protein
MFLIFLTPQFVVDLPYYLRSFIYNTHFIYCFCFEEKDKWEKVNQANLSNVRECEYMRKGVDSIVHYTR